MLEFFESAFDASPVGMLVVDRSGSIVAVNQQLEALFGYARTELVGSKIERLVDGIPTGHVKLRDAYMEQPRSREMTRGRDLFGLHKDGRQVPVEIGLSPMKTGSGDLVVLASVIDLTERRRAQKALEASLAEKETLLRELHHRSKNNLQLIASMLDLAAGQRSGDPLTSSRERIHSMALIHERLSQSGRYAEISLHEYLTALAGLVAHTWNEGAQVECRIEGDPVRLSIDQAIPAGLMLNELLSNAYKHAFPDGRNGQIVVHTAHEGTEVVLSVKDDGVGMPQHIDTTEHIGLELVRTLARQLRGKVSFMSQGGTDVTLRFPAGPTS